MATRAAGPSSFLPRYIDFTFQPFKVEKTVFVKDRENTVKQKGSDKTFPPYYPDIPIVDIFKCFLSDFL